MITEAQVLAALPTRGFLREYVEFASTCTDAHMVYHVGTGLTLLTQTAPINLCARLGGPLYANLFILLVGPSTESRKGAAITAAENLLHDAVPSMPVETPGSDEGLVEGLRTFPRQVVMYSEFGEFLAKSEHSYLTAIKTKYTSLFDSKASATGRALSKSRRGMVENPRLSLLCGCAPEYLERHTETVDWTGGFMARFLTLFAERERTYDMPVENFDIRAHLVDVLRTRAAIENQVCGAFEGFTEEALAEWKKWHRATTGRKDATEVTKGAFGRAPSAVLKMATLLSWDYGEASAGGPWRITMDELAPAMAFADFHIRSIAVIGENLADSKDMRERRRVLLAVRAVARPFGEILREAKLLKKRAEEIIETLIEEGEIERVLITGQQFPWIRRVAKSTSAGGTVIPFPIQPASPASSESDDDDDEDDGGVLR